MTFQTGKGVFTMGKRQTLQVEQLFDDGTHPVIAGREADIEAKLSAMQGQILGTADIEKLVGIKAASVRRLVARGTFPPPDGHLGVTPWWRVETVEEWQRSRRPSGRPSKKGETR